MKIIKFFSSLSLLILFMCSLSSAVIVPKQSELVVAQGQNPSAKTDKSTKQLYKLKQKLSKATSTARKDKLSHKIDKIAKVTDKSETTLIAILGGILVLAVAILSVVLKGTALLILAAILGGIALITLIVWGLAALLKGR